MELMETRLVAEFHRWAQTYEVRARGTSRAVAEFDERSGLLEERLATPGKSKKGIVFTSEYACPPATLTSLRKQ
jgi:7-keto-8-aminopelargonate synthetase-like enzyme